jgi:hypothetical protein
MEPFFFLRHENDAKRELARQIDLRSLVLLREAAIASGA